MSHRTSSLIPAAALVLALSAASNDARACGGCFAPSTTEPTLVSAHRMAFAISKERTVLWDQIEYTGDPEDFAWVLPVKAGAFVELAEDAFFEALDGATSTQIVSQTLTCNVYAASSAECGCGDAAGYEPRDAHSVDDDPSVTVTHHATIGPYETVTLQSNTPGALYTWLGEHGYAVSPSVEPVIDAYEAEGFDFIALRLVPGQAVSAMQPVRVVTPGASPVLPLRMVAAGAGPEVALTLFVIGEGRWEVSGFPNATISPSQIEWDYAAQKSNYALLRQQTLAQKEGRTWLTSSAKRSTLFFPTQNPVTKRPLVYESDSGEADTIAELYLRQADANGSPGAALCAGAFEVAGQKADAVVDACASGGEGGLLKPCDTAPGAGEVDARRFVCGKLDDLGVALLGLHLGDVWLTRLEASLPQAALGEDMALSAAPQSEVENWMLATGIVNPPCEDYEVSPPASPIGLRGTGPRGGSGRGPLAAVLGVWLVLLCRRALRSLRRDPRAALSGASARGAVPSV